MPILVQISPKPQLKGLIAAISAGRSGRQGRQDRHLFRMITHACSLKCACVLTSAGRLGVVYNTHRTRKTAVSVTCRAGRARRAATTIGLDVITGNVIAAACSSSGP